MHPSTQRFKPKFEPDLKAARGEIPLRSYVVAGEEVDGYAAVASGSPIPNRQPAPTTKITDSTQEEDIQALRTAVATLEHPRLAARLTEIAGKPIELCNRALPETASKAIAVATTQALNTALRVALRTMQNEPKAASSYLHKALAATSGTIGGSFG